MADFFYDSQIRRYLIQFGKLFSNWQVTKGRDQSGNDILIRVPVVYGDPSRQAAVVQGNNSASTLPSAPLISYYITGLEYEQRRTQDPTFIDRMQIRQRAVDPVTGQYLTTQAQAFTVERIMPVPYTLRMQVDLWTTNYQQKLEFVEQVGTLFNPSLEIQSNDSYLDWASLSIVHQDGLTFSSRSIPAGGATNQIDILSWKFWMPIWLSPPAKVKKMGVVHKIITSIREGSTMDDMQNDDILMGTRQKVTPYGYQLLFQGNTLQLLPANQPHYPPNSALPAVNAPDTDIYWTSLLNVYGKVSPGVSQIWLEHPNMDTYIVGTIVPDPVDDRLLIFNVDQDTLPQNTLPPVDSVIDPLASGPGAGLPIAEHGTRYLLTDDIGAEGSSTTAWGTVVAKANDIIQFDGPSGQWYVSFSANDTNGVQFVTNLTTGIQYRYDGEWSKSVEGWYDQGSWSIVI